MTHWWWLRCPRCDRPLEEACGPWRQPKLLDRAPYDSECFFEELRERAQAGRARLVRLAAIAPARRTPAESAELVAAVRRTEKRRIYQRDWQRAQRAEARAAGRNAGRVLAMPAPPARTGVLDGLAKVG